MQFDPISDAFTRIFNAEQAGHYEVTVLRTISASIRESMTDEEDRSESN